MVAITLRLSFVLSMLSMLLVALAVPHPMFDDGVHAPPPSRSLDQASLTNGQRIARGLPIAKPKTLYSKRDKRE
jgi:hypothetical protein